MTVEAPAKAGFTMTGERDDMVASLAPAERFVSRHTSNPALQHLRLRADASTGEQVVEATDLSMSYRGHLWATFDQPLVDVLVAPKLRRAIAAMPSGTVTVKQGDGGELEVRGSGKARYTVPLGSGDIGNVTPGMEDVDWENVPATDAADALEAMALAGRFVAKGEQNPSITGVNLRQDREADELVVSATDGIRLVEVRVPLPSDSFPFGEQDVTLPVRMVEELRRLFPTGELKMSADDKAFFAAAPQGGTYFQSRRIGGKFPDTSGMIPEATGKVTLPREETREALKKLQDVTHGKVVSLEVTENQMRLHVRGDEGEAEEWVDVPGSSGLVMAFNLDYLLSGVELFKGDEVELSYATPLRPAILTADGEARRMVQMPVRLP